MMRTRKGFDSRSELKNKLDRTEKGLDKKVERLGVSKDDVMGVRGMDGDLDRTGMTTEALEGLDGTMNGAHDSAIETFKRDDGALEDAKGEGKDFKETLEEKKEIDEADEGVIRDGAAKLDSAEIVKRLEKAEQILREDADIIAGTIRATKEALEKSEQAQKQLRDHVQNGKMT